MRRLPPIAIMAAAATLVFSSTLSAATAAAPTSVPATPATPAVAPGPACGALRRASAGATDSPALLASYPSAPAGLLHDSAFVYDNAVAAIALVSCGHLLQARHIGDALLYAQEHDRYWHDGRLRNGYVPGTASGSMRQPGFQDPAQRRWLEDSYQAGSDSGNLAWAALALLHLHEVTHDARYLAGATRLASWLETQADTRGAGGYRGGVEGFEPHPAAIAWKATEHNIDLYAMFTWLARPGDTARWHADARRAQSFVAASWQQHCGCFATGTELDGVRYKSFLALDAQVWALLALPDMDAKHAAVRATLEQRLRVGRGYTYSEAGHAVWNEGTAQVELLARVLGNTADADALHALLETQRAPDGGVYATDGDNLDTGLGGRQYRHLSHLGATAWAALAEQGYNPFTPRVSLAK